MKIPFGKQNQVNLIRLLSFSKKFLMVFNITRLANSLGYSYAPVLFDGKALLFRFLETAKAKEF